MAKKIVKLSESQLRKLISEVIKEQNLATTNSIQQYPQHKHRFKDERTDLEYTLPQINSAADVDKYFSWGGNDNLSIYNNLKSVGLDLKYYYDQSLDKEKNLGQKRNSGQQTNLEDYTTPLNYLSAAIYTILRTVATRDIDTNKIVTMGPYFLNLMDIVSGNAYQFKKHLPHYFDGEQNNDETKSYSLNEFLNAAAKIVENQKNKLNNISSTTKKT